MDVKEAQHVAEGRFREFEEPQRVAHKVAVLGWGSLLWETETDRAREFDKCHEEWFLDGPRLRLEFSRISRSRDGALTLVIDYENGGSPTQVAYTLSKREHPEDAACDLRCREGTVLNKIGCYFANVKESYKTRWVDAPEDAQKAIEKWAQDRVDVVVWTALGSNFMQCKCEKFSIDAAKRHVQSLDAVGKARAAEYIWRAPAFVDTPLRVALQSEPWFPKPFLD